MIRIGLINDNSREVKLFYPSNIFFQGALHENLIKPKGDAEVVNKLVEDIVPLSVKMNELDVTIRCLKDSEKDELQVGLRKFMFQ